MANPDFHVKPLTVWWIHSTWWLRSDCGVGGYVACYILFFYWRHIQGNQPIQILWVYSWLRLKWVLHVAVWITWF